MFLQGSFAGMPVSNSCLISRLAIIFLGLKSWGHSIWYKFNFNSIQKFVDNILLKLKSKFNVCTPYHVLSNFVFVVDAFDILMIKFHGFVESGGRFMFQFGLRYAQAIWKMCSSSGIVWQYLFQWGSCWIIKFNCGHGRRVRIWLTRGASMFVSEVYSPIDL